MFKKLLLFLVAIFMIIFMWTANSSVKTFAFALKKEVYLYKSSSSGIITPYQDFCLFKRGESFKIDYEQSIDNLCEYFDAEIKFTEKTDEGTHYYLFSKKTKYIEIINGEKISIHIFIGSGKTVIGTPIIYGSI